MSGNKRVEVQWERIKMEVECRGYEQFWMAFTGATMRTSKLQRQEVHIGLEYRFSNCTAPYTTL